MNMKEKESENQNKRILLICNCGCKAQLQIQHIEDGEYMIDTRTDGRRRWTGVVLKKKDVNKLKKFLSTDS